MCVLLDIAPKDDWGGTPLRTQFDSSTCFSYAVSDQDTFPMLTERNRVGGIKLARYAVFGWLDRRER
jgi:hypothetical protein